MNTSGRRGLPEQRAVPAAGRLYSRFASFLGTKLHIGTNPVKSAMHICDVSYDFLLFLLLFHKKKWVSFIFILLFLSHEIRGKYLHGAAVEHGAR
jgi:hypothetical protein